jgi:hypothetical protein
MAPSFNLLWCYRHEKYVTALESCDDWNDKETDRPASLRAWFLP